MRRAITLLDALARKHSVKLRQSYVRMAKRVAIMASRDAHPKEPCHMNWTGWKVSLLLGWVVAPALVQASPLPARGRAITGTSMRWSSSSNGSAIGPGTQWTMKARSWTFLVDRYQGPSG